MANDETMTEEKPEIDVRPQLDATAEQGETVGMDSPPQDEGKSINALLNVKLEVRVILGRNQMPISELLTLTRGTVIELDRKVGEPVDIMINDRVVAQGELIKVNGDQLGVALREIIKDFNPSV